MSEIVADPIVEVRLVEAEVRVLSCKPGDVVLLKVPASALPMPEIGDESWDALGRIASMLKEALPLGVNVRVLALDGDIEVSVVEA